MSTTIHISGLNTDPVVLLHPASDSHYWAYPQVSLLTCWLNFVQVGLSRFYARNHPLDNNTKFHDLTANPNGSNLTWHEQPIVSTQMQIKIRCYLINSNLITFTDSPASIRQI